MNRTVWAATTSITLAVLMPAAASTASHAAGRTSSVAGTGRATLATPRRLPTDFQAVPGQLLSAEHGSIVYVLGQNQSGLFRRQGGLWSRVHYPRNWYLDAIALTPAGGLWAAGSEAIGGNRSDEALLIATWANGTWSRLALPSTVKSNRPGRGFQPIQVLAASSPTNVWAGGDLYESKTTPNGLLHWDGTQWTFVAPPSDVPLYIGSFFTFQAVATSSPSNTWAVVGDGLAGWQILHWDGTALTPTAAKGHGQGPDSIATTSPNCVWAVPGTGGGAQGGVTNRKIVDMLRFDGHTWRLLKKSIGRRHWYRLDEVSLAGCTAWAAGTTLAMSGSRDRAARPLVVRSTGSSIAIVTSKPRRAYYWIFTGITALARTRALAVGEQGGNGHPTRPIVEKLS